MNEIGSPAGSLVECGHLESLEEACRSCNGKFHYCSSGDCYLFTATCEHAGGCPRSCDGWDTESPESEDLKCCDEIGLACMRREGGDYSEQVD